MGIGLAVTPQWAYCGTSVKGTSHKKSGLPCQDSHSLLVADRFFVATVADGAGSARLSNKGSAAACESLQLAISEHFAAGLGLSAMGQNFFETWLSRLNSQLKELAASENAALRDYSTTLLAAILGPSSAVFFQIGDGAIVVGDPDQPEEFSWIFWPDQGAYANETTFVTSEGAAAAAQFSYVERQINEAALFSDGIQRLALNIASQTVHSPFFRHLFGPLRHEAAGLSQRISGAIELFLDSEAVCERTDDDKTLVLARRVFDE